MSGNQPGPHHCIGTARSVSEVVFRTLRAKCVAAGGALSLDELDQYYFQILESFADGYDLFELRHHSCMDASLGMAEMPFARGKILATMLRACGEKSARGVFSFQIERLGMEWIVEFFDALAIYVRHHTKADIDRRLIRAYVDTAMIPKIKLTIEELLRQNSIKGILFECATAFRTLNSSPSGITEITDWVNKAIAGKRNVGKPDVCKVTENEIDSFVTLLPNEILITLGVKLDTERVVETTAALVEGTS